MLKNKLQSQGAVSFPQPVNQMTKDSSVDKNWIKKIKRIEFYSALGRLVFSAVLGQTALERAMSQHCLVKQSFPIIQDHYPPRHHFGGFGGWGAGTGGRERRESYYFGCGSCQVDVGVHVSVGVASGVHSMSYMD